MENIFLNLFDKFSSLNVSRETYIDFETFVSMIQEKNKIINIISKKNAINSYIMKRHILDSAQIIDFIDLNYNSSTDLGSGGGMPGIVIAILMKKINKGIKVNLYEKSHNKCKFLHEVSKKLNLNTRIIKKDIFLEKNLETGTIMSRAFKPIPIILDLVNENFLKFKNLVIFMGSSGDSVLKNTLSQWNLNYEKKKSLTNNSSFLLNIKKIEKKKNENYFNH